MTAAATAVPARRPGAASRLTRQPLAAAGGLIVIAFVAVALLAPVLPLPDQDLGEAVNRLKAPLSGFGLLGTDQHGRDVLARLAFGLRVSLGVGAAATLAAAVVGSAIGLVAAFYGRLADSLLMRAVDVLMAFPYLLLALAIVAALGPGLTNAAFAIAVANVPFFARAVRGAALGVVGRDFVDAARMAGLSDARILLTEVLPNVAPLIVVTAATTIGWMILETAGLSFLGLGAQPPQSDLGSMLADGRKALAVAPHVAAVAGAAIFVLAVGLNLLGDGVRDLLDPRMEAGQGGAPAKATRVELGGALPSPLPGGERACPGLDPGSRGEAEAGEGGQGFPERARPPHPSLRADLSPPGRGEDSRSVMCALLSVQNLTVSFDAASGRHAAVRDVSFSLPRGGSLGIVGESGSGKSVTALSLARLAASPPGVITAGDVALDGEDVLSAPFGRLRQIRGARVAYVFQDPSTTLDPLMPVGRQIAEAAAAHGAAGAGARAKKLAEEVGLPDPDRVLAAYPHQLSGGQRQRIGIAIALAQDPDVLVADEPTTALDATTQAKVLKLFCELRARRGAALIFVSHDLAVVETLCERVAVFYAGEIVEEGPTAEVLAAPRHPYTARLIACAPKLGEPDRALEPIEGGPPPIDDRPEGCAFAPRCRLAIEACRAGPIALAAEGEGRAARCIRTQEVALGRA
ncbi:dipeptide/oligopeptide/nickel ABC transporter permease/ATP-binding protein [Methylopila sp. M107]|uniref:dipeptide/oligopeptide/nickel ABC transporter permease/ATP-binding protein n=1 Tax=Methylopila sp. M107 TaxID=1101190 RepID=UPI00037196F6|nr:dipeptide/oligopeptide/nickel ABC transporter permease/ATP-binding protein [Methylopila sp. M107]